MPSDASTRRVSDFGTDDAVLQFAVTPLDIRGRVVRLGPAFDQIIRQHGYASEIARAVGEAITLTVLLGSSLKSGSRFQLQTRSDGVISMLVVDFDGPGALRAYARFNAAALEKARATNAVSTAALLGNGHLALTIDQGPAASQYQGVVALDGQGLEAAAHEYFQQSEQIPTKIRLAVGEILQPGDSTGQWRAGGLMVQFLPESLERQRAVQGEQASAPGYATEAAAVEDDLWNEAMILASSAEDHELLDPAVSSERLLYRLFHERGVTVFETNAVEHACHCARDRMTAMLRQFSNQEIQDMIGEDGKIGVTCEFCGTAQTFDPADVDN